MSDAHEPYEALFQIAAMSLATVGARGEPHAAAVYFVAVHPAGAPISRAEQPAEQPAWRLYFFSEAHSQHAQDATRNPAAAATVYAESQDWQDIRGLQMRGKVSPVAPGPEWQRAWKVYCEKFPFARQFEAVVARNTLYAFSPAWVRLVDNRQGFGFKQEWTW